MDISGGIFSLRRLFTSGEPSVDPGPTTCGSGGAKDPLPPWQYAPDPWR